MYLYMYKQACTVQRDAQSLNASLLAIAICSSCEAITLFRRFFRDLRAISFFPFFFLSFLRRHDDRDRDIKTRTTTRRDEDENTTPTRRTRYDYSHRDSNTWRLASVLDCFQDSLTCWRVPCKIRVFLIKSSALRVLCTKWSACGSKSSSLVSILASCSLCGRVVRSSKKCVRCLGHEGSSSAVSSTFAACAAALLLWFFSSSGWSGSASVSELSRACFPFPLESRA